MGVEMLAVAASCLVAVGHRCRVLPAALWSVAAAAVVVGAAVAVEAAAGGAAEVVEAAAAAVVVVLWARTEAVAIACQLVLASRIMVCKFSTNC